MTDDALADEILGYLPEGIRHRSGSMLMSGRDAWRVDPHGSPRSHPLYILGFNPGGAPAETDQAIEDQAASVLAHARYSSFVEESWVVGGRKHAAGEAKLQKSVLHVLDQVRLDPYETPASNVNFVRSVSIADLAKDDHAWAAECWPFHAAMFSRLGTKVVLCLGKPTADFVRAKVGSHAVADRFTEYNRRGYSTVTYTGGSVDVISAYHPGRFPWYPENSDISPLVARALA